MFLLLSFALPLLLLFLKLLVCHCCHSGGGERFVGSCTCSIRTIMFKMHFQKFRILIVFTTRFVPKLNCSFFARGKFLTFRIHENEYLVQAKNNLQIVPGRRRSILEALSFQFRNQ